jgi:hypothetical protein
VLPAAESELDGHASQPIEAAAAENLLASQSLHATEPGADLYVPAAHAVHKSAGPLNPALHSHATLPAAELASPAHASQATAAELEENMPAAHSTQAPDPESDLNVPAAHAEQVSCAPVYPALQTHSYAPAAAWVFAGQS